MKKSKFAPFIIIVVLGILLLLVRRCNNKPKEESEQKTTKQKTQRGLNRNPQNLKYSKHARCRMDCRHITDAEVKQVLKNGVINYKKSELNNDDCHKKYAVEDYANKQHLRIVFAPCGNTVTVVTCIDLEKEWQCACPGDEH